MSKDRSHKDSLTARAREMYSLSALEIAIVSCHLAVQDIAVPFTVKQKPLIDRLSLSSAAQLASQ